VVPKPTFKPANEAIQRLVQAGILQQITVGRRNRAYEAPEIVDAFTDLERPSTRERSGI
jgi:hypothetical protein